ncbi:MAG: C10 family peptidase [Bacteroidota bacterium]
MILAIFSFQVIFSQENIKAIEKYATNSFSEIFNTVKTPKNCIILNTENTNKEYVFNFINGGYIIVIEKSKNFDVLAFSENNEFIVKDNPFLRGKEDKSLTISLNKLDENTEKNNVKDSEDDVPPFMTDVWGGVNCHDQSGGNVYPSNYYTPYHCSPGCVAIAPSQILHYYEWPITGVGSNVFADNYNGNLIRHQGFFDNTYYDWANMLDEYMGVNSTTEEQQAVGVLMYNMGVALQMDYEPSGSTNNIDNIPFVLENFFRFSGHYEIEAWADFWPRLYESMHQHRPVPIAVENTNTGDGHVMVVNGYKYLNSKNYYYINWGWWNAYGLNGYYNLQGWNSGTSGYNLVLGAIFDMLPEPHITSITPNGNGDDFEVHWEISDQLNWEEFTLQKKVDQGNWEDVATGINGQGYTITNPTGTVYQFRVKAKVDGFYYSGSYSEVEVYAVENWYNGYASFDGNQYAYARQTPDNDLDFFGDYTFETWIRLDSDNQNGDVILDQETVFGFTVYEVTASDYSVRFNSHATNQSISSNQSGSKLQIDQWYHIAVSKTGNQTKLFVNGTERAVYNGSSLNLTTANYALNIGEKYHGSYSSWIKADFDQMRISSIGRYPSNFTPTRDHQFANDAETIAYFTFQDVHRVRLKDDVHNISVIVKNAINYVTWNFEESVGSLTIEEEQFFNDNISVFPNPCSDIINIKIEESATFKTADFTFDLYNANGKLIYRKKKTESNNTFIDITDLKSGMYILQLKTKHIIATKKIIKQ